ncbi:hypothetical protein ACJJTC_011696, partial [Scirpophaga incertulas]
MRSMSVEQRWQDLASLLTIPPPPEQYHHHHHQQHHQHPHNITAHGAVGGYAPNYHASLPPVPEKHPDPYAGAAAPMEGSYKVESAHHPQQHDSIYYQNSTSEMAPPPNQDGFLQSILNDEDLQLMDMAMNEGMYTMRMLDGASGHHPTHHNHTHMMMTTAERDSASDSAVSSMGSERVPSLSDGEWCDGSDSAQEFHSSKFRPYESAYGRDRNATHQPQKKHHMFGKRCFQEQAPQQLEPLPPRVAPAVKYECPEQTYHHDPMHMQTDFVPRGPLVPPHGASLQPPLDLNTPHSSHTLLQGVVPGGGSGRVGVRAPHGHGHSHNHTYAAPPAPPHARPHRDKRGAPFKIGTGNSLVAAQNCRKRKLDQITSLADEVRTVRDRKQRTQRDHHQLLADRQRVKERFAALYRHVFQVRHCSATAPCSLSDHVAGGRGAHRARPQAAHAARPPPAAGRPPARQGALRRALPPRLPGAPLLRHCSLLTIRSRRWRTRCAPCATASSARSATTTSCWPTASASRSASPRSTATSSRCATAPPLLPAHYQITSLADEVRTVRDRKQRTQRDHHQLLADRQRVKERFAALYRHVFQVRHCSATAPCSLSDHVAGGRGAHRARPQAAHAARPPPAAGRPPARQGALRRALPATSSRCATAPPLLPAHYQITSLADEVRTVRDRKQRTQRDHHQLLADRQRVKERFAALYRHVFQVRHCSATAPCSLSDHVAGGRGAHRARPQAAHAARPPPAAGRPPARQGALRRALPPRLPGAPLLRHCPPCSLSLWPPTLPSPLYPLFQVPPLSATAPCSLLTSWPFHLPQPPRHPHPTAPPPTLPNASPSPGPFHAHSFCHCSLSLSITSLAHPPSHPTPRPTTHHCFRPHAPKPFARSLRHASIPLLRHCSLLTFNHVPHPGPPPPNHHATPPHPLLAPHAQTFRPLPNPTLPCPSPHCSLLLSISLLPPCPCHRKAGTRRPPPAAGKSKFLGFKESFQVGKCSDSLGNFSYVGKVRTGEPKREGAGTSALGEGRRLGSRPRLGDAYCTFPFSIGFPNLFK